MQLDTAVGRHSINVKAIEQFKDASRSTPMNGKCLAAEVFQTQQDSVIALAFGNIPKRPFAAKHEIDRIDDERFAGVGRTVEHVKTGSERNSCRVFIRPE